RNYLGRAYLYADDRKWSAAISDLDRAMALDPAQPIWLYNKIQLALDNGDNDLAYRSAEKFLETEGVTSDRSGWVLIHGYIALLKLGRADEGKKFVGRFRSPETPGVMPAKGLGVLLGTVTEKDFLAEAADDDRKLADAHCILGEQSLINGDK